MFNSKGKNLRKLEYSWDYLIKYPEFYFKSYNIIQYFFWQHVILPWFDLRRTEILFITLLSKEHWPVSTSDPIHTFNGRDKIQTAKYISPKVLLFRKYLQDKKIAR